MVLQEIKLQLINIIVNFKLRVFLSILFQSLVLSVIDVIKNTGEGALEVFHLLLENCQEPENRGDYYCVKQITKLSLSFIKEKSQSKLSEQTLW